MRALAAPPIGGVHRQRTTSPVAGDGRIAVVAGTRPEIIKLAPVIAALESQLGSMATLIIDTGQHYDHAMSGQFWAQLGVRPPDVTFRGGGLTRAHCVGYLTTGLGQLLAERRPAAVVVQGDTNSTLAGALAANAEGTPLIHVEAGLRSGDRAMPEEHNRVMVDHLADLCCAATADNVANLRAEGIGVERIALTGNTIVEGVRGQLPEPDERAATLAAHGLAADHYILATIHRPENTDDPNVLLEILSAFDALAGRLPVVVALHPRTRRAVTTSGATAKLDRLRVTGPLGSREFLSLAAHAAVIVSDSGGVAEEVTVLKRPLVVVRRSTERAESIAAGFARLAQPARIEEVTGSVLAHHDALLRRLASTPSPFGDGTASQQIAQLTVALAQAEERPRV